MENARLIEALAPPPTSLLQRELASGAFADAYALQRPGRVAQADWVAAFYTSPVFKLERWILACLGFPSSDEQARSLAYGQAQAYAAWRVEARQPQQLLMRDATGRTCSWLSVEELRAGDSAVATRLWFGSAVRPRPAAAGRAGRAGGKAGFGLAFHLLLGLHKAYSRALLASAARRLEQVRHQSASDAAA